MSETTELLESPHADTSAAPRGLSSMVLPELKAMASKLGIKGTSAMRKGDLIAAIGSRNNQAHSAPASSSAAETAPAPAPQHAENGHTPAGGGEHRGEHQNGHAHHHDNTGDDSGNNGGHGQPHQEYAASAQVAVAAPEHGNDRGTQHDGDQHDGTQHDGNQPHQPQHDAPAGQSAHESAPSASAQVSEPPANSSADAEGNSGGQQERTNGAGNGGAPTGSGGSDEYPSRDRSRRSRRNRRDRNSPADSTDGGEGGDRPAPARPQGGNAQGGNQGNQGNQGGNAQGNQNRSAQNPNQGGNQGGSQNNQGGSQGGNQYGNQYGNQDDDLDADGQRRGRRYRDRNRRTRERFTESPTDIEVRDDDVLLPVAGILDVLDSYAFVRTSGYLTGSNDVYVSLSQVRKYSLRRGDAVTGAVRAPREGEAARQKFNALVRLDSVNGQDPETARNRPEFTKLTPLYPNERLRLETEGHLLTTRVIDLVMPVGKGQRALIVSPPKAGKTTVLQAIANAIAKNNPEVHLMVVLVDERPEEVTDMQRSVKGEVIASTFDRPPGDHTQLAELAIERAKRLVEMGRDVVVLLDNITRLGRAYNLAAPASGRILSGGVDSTALFPPKRFLGAARNIEHGGSLTIFASALVETGSAGDTVIFEEFKGTGNAELKLDRRLADKRIFPAIDIDQSGTRKENLLMSPDEYAVMLKLRRVLGALDSQQALDLVLDRLRKTRSNVEFLMQVAATTPNADRD